MTQNDATLYLSDKVLKWIRAAQLNRQDEKIELLMNDRSNDRCCCVLSAIGRSLIGILKPITKMPLFTEQ
ncbi:MAG: hypothetical protein C4288_10250 [Leptolyngbya sp. ERB_1_1]